MYLNFLFLAGLYRNIPACSDLGVDFDRLALKPLQGHVVGEEP